MNCSEIRTCGTGGKVSNGENFRIIRKRAVCAKLKTIETLFSAYVGVA